MTRSIYKPNYLSKSIASKVINKCESIQTHSRSSVIPQELVNKKMFIYNGKSYTEIVISEDMVGHKLGEFSYTRKIIYEKTDRRKKKQLKKR